MIWMILGGVWFVGLVTICGMLGVGRADDDGPTVYGQCEECGRHTAVGVGSGLCRRCEWVAELYLGD